MDNKVYRLEVGGQPLTNEELARQFFGTFQSKNNNAGYFYAQKDNNKVLNCIIVTGDWRHEFVQRAMQIMGLHMKSALPLFGKGFVKKARAAEDSLWKDFLDRSEPLEINK